MILGLQELIQIERADHISFPGTPLSWNMNRQRMAKGLPFDTLAKGWANVIESGPDPLKVFVRKTLLIFPQDYRFYYVCVLKNREFVE